MNGDKPGTEFCRAYCRKRGWRYISHDRFASNLDIAVESSSGARWFERLSFVDVLAALDGLYVGEKESA